MADAKLYEVRMGKGTVYALRDAITGTIWTERSEYSARQLANEKGYTLIEEKTISHEELLRMVGHEPTATPKSPAPPKPAREPQPEHEAQRAETVVERALGEQYLVPSPAISFPVKYHLADEPASVLVKMNDDPAVPESLDASKVKSVFFSDGQIMPPLGNDGVDGVFGKRT